jgi:hypothetical protein
MLIYTRIPLLAAEERSAAGLYVHYDQAYLFLRIPPQEICKFPSSLPESGLIFPE